MRTPPPPKKDENDVFGPSNGAEGDHEARHSLRRLARQGVLHRDDQSPETRTMITS